MRKTDATLIATGAVVLAAIAGSRFGPTSRQVGNAVWYATLRKPEYRPSGPTIGAAWMGLDVLLSYAGGRLLAAPPSPARQTAVAGWGATVLGLAAYPWLMFGQRRLGAALAAALGMFGATLTAAAAGSTVDRKAAGALLPLLAWLGFASVLQEEIWRRNR